jgi:hypothetical protein
MIGSVIAHKTLQSQEILNGVSSKVTNMRAGLLLLLALTHESSYYSKSNTTINTIRSKISSINTCSRRSNISRIIIVCNSTYRSSSSNTSSNIRRNISIAMVVVVVVVVVVHGGGGGCSGSGGDIGGCSGLIYLRTV